MEELPCFSWLPKLHKTLFVSRFIAASNKCTMKPLSGLLTACLHTVNLHFKEYNYYYSGVFKNSDINCFWIVNNSLRNDKLVEMLEYLIDAIYISKAKTNRRYQKCRK